MTQVLDVWPPCTAQENHAWLLARFCSLLKSFTPQSVLDVGCGAGLLIRTLSESGASVHGLDQAGPRLEALAEEGFDVREGSAYELPFADCSIDWISLRHVPHHLEDPGRAIAEALRVARSGLLLAEPSFDPSLPSQLAAQQLDRWEKRQHRRRGMFHADVLELDDLVELMPTELRRVRPIEAHTHLRPRGRCIEEFEAEATELVSELAEYHPERSALAGLLRGLRKSGLSWNGSLCVAIRTH